MHEVDLFLTVLCDCVVGKQNHHGGSSDIYLDDLTTLDPEVAELYFPKA